MFGAQKINAKSDSLTGIFELLSMKSDAAGQDIVSYLEGVLETKHTSYWDYINLDALLSLQHTKTGNADEKVFIIYHQVSELFFRLIIHEIEQLLEDGLQDLDRAHQKVQRLNNYYQYLIHTFPILVDCIEREAFQLFRKALYPASGQQSIQFRMIELFSTGVPNLVHQQFRSSLTGAESIEEMYPRLYWQSPPGHKSATLQQFEEKYYHQLVALAYKCTSRNLCHFVNVNLHKICNHDIFDSLRQFDYNANVKWPIEHYKCVSHNLGKSQKVTSTGNTDWQKYLQPQYRQIMFFPVLWTDAEKESWGTIPDNINSAH